MQDLYGKGGLQLQDIGTKIKASRVKWLSHILTCKPSDFERLLCDKLIGKVSGFYGIKVLKGTNSKIDSKIPHKFYRSAVSHWRELSVRYSPGNLNCISQDWIYNNNLLKSPDGIVFTLPTNYRNPEKLPYYVPKIFHDLPVKSPEWGMRVEFRQLIRHMNEAYSSIQYHPSGKDCYLVHINEEYKDLLSLSFNDVYTFLLSKKTVARPWIVKWESEFELSSESWKDIWRNIHDSTLCYEVQSSAWEIIHRNFVSSSYIFRFIDSSVDPICKLCHILEDHRTHIIISCDVMCRVFKHFLTLLKLLDNSPLELEEIIFGITGDCKGLRRIRNYLTFNIKHILFRNRNNDFGGAQSAVPALVNKIRSYIISDLTLKYHVYKYRNRVDVFEKTFCLNNIIASVENGCLLVNI